MKRFLQRNKYHTEWENPHAQQFQQPPELLQRSQSSQTQQYPKKKQQQRAPVVHNDDFEEREQLVDSLYGVWKDCMHVMNMQVPQEIPKECFLSCFHLVGALESVMKAVMLNTPHWRDDLDNVVLMMEEGFQITSQLSDSEEAQDTASDISEAEELSNNAMKKKWFKRSSKKSGSRFHL